MRITSLRCHFNPCSSILNQMYPSMIPFASALIQLKFLFQLFFIIKKKNYPHSQHFHTKNIFCAAIWYGGMARTCFNAADVLGMLFAFCGAIDVNFLRCCAKGMRAGCVHNMTVNINCAPSVETQQELRLVGVVHTWPALHILPRWCCFSQPPTVQENLISL